MPREVKRSVSRTVKMYRRDAADPTPGFRPLSAAAFRAGREAAVRASMAARNQIRRLSHGGAHRQRARATADWTGLDWTDKYPSAVAALANLNIKTAYFDGELCGVDEAGLPTFAHTQAATDGERGAARLLRFRSSASRWSGHLAPSAHRAQSAFGTVARKQAGSSVQWP